jgi:alpha-galactosidase
VTGFGSRSTLFAAPAGALVNRDTGVVFAWQIEHNGAWMWEVGELADRGRGIIPPDGRVRDPRPAGVMQGDSSHDGAYVAVSGPLETRHSWSKVLAPGTSFTTVPATFTVAASLDDALGNLARHRRTSRRPHPQNDMLPVVFNDYMNTLVGDPTEEKLLPLIDAAAAVGADYFCIDAGWYDDEDGWWVGVGDWEPSTSRFPSGLDGVLRHIREKGMLPGLWVEPEVIGVASAAARTLPDEAFITRDGVRVCVNDRYFLDLREPAARKHLDAAIDRLVNELGARYFKFDYNVSPGTGLDRNADSLGDGLLQHNRAVVDWMAGLLERYPDLILESCSGGGGRTDFATLSQLQLASTSDQENPLAYPAVAVGSLAHILPEQAGNWAYPQASMSDQDIAFAMAVGLAGRLYLAGVLNEMNDHQLAIVREGVEAHNATKHFISRATPVFPLGFPDWNDAWVAVGFEADDELTHDLLLIAWALPGAGEEVEIPLRRADATHIERIYPSDDIGAGWSAQLADASLRLTRPAALPTAAMFRISSKGVANA